MNALASISNRHGFSTVGRVSLERGVEFVKLREMIERMESDQSVEHDDAPYRMLLWLLCTHHPGADTTSALLKHRITYLVYDPRQGLGDVETLIDPFVKLHYHALHTGKFDVLFASDQTDPIELFKSALDRDSQLVKLLNKQIEKFGEDTLVENYRFFGEDL